MVLWLVAFAALSVVLAILLHVTQRKVALAERRLQNAAAGLEHLQGSFERFAPREVVERIIEDGQATDADKREVTVLFADIKGFTTMTEALDPAVVVQVLNGYFAAMSRVLVANNGHVSKFIGDGILALFGAPLPNPWQTNDAVRAALGMRDALAGYNRKLVARGLATIEMGVGIHRGLVVSGVIGTMELMEYTAIGATVNLASRVEGLTRRHDVDILITQEVRSTIDPRFRVTEMPPGRVKGVAMPVVTYGVEGLDENGAGTSSVEANP